LAQRFVSRQRTVTQVVVLGDLERLDQWRG
jgi:hypothetical protein